jgi:hypothetical protein
MLILFLMLLISAQASVGGNISPSVKAGAAAGTAREFYPGDRIQNTRTIHKFPLNHTRRDDIIGERFIAGDTWYDFNSNGSIGKMIAVDADGGVHITWMDGLDDDLEGGERLQKYNFFSPDDEWLWEGGWEVFETDRGGFGCLCLTTDENPRAMIFYHGKIDTAWQSFCAVDFEYAWGAFEITLLPSFPEMVVYYPQGVMSPEGRIHIATQRRDRGMISYISGELNEDGQPVLAEMPAAVGETHRTTLRIACSKQSERAAIVWLTSRVGIPAPEDWAGTGVYSMNNDLMLAWTDNGEDWNFDDPLNITQVIPPNPDLEGDPAYGDTLRPFATFDVIFDPDDNIHVVFDARGFWEQPIPVDIPPVDAITIDASYLFHWDEASGEITPVADGWYAHREVDENGDEIRWPTPGAWKSNVCLPSLTYDENGDLYCVFNNYPLNDYSLENYCNGDIAVTVSEDNGATWYMPTHITETRTHLAEEGESECEVYPTVAERVDEFLHITYELDTEPGSLIEDYTDRNEWQTLCPWMYHRMPVEEVQRDSVWENGPNWHAEYLEVGGEAQALVPGQLQVENIFPNPFNSETSITYQVSTPAKVDVVLLDINGRLIRELFNGRNEAGKHRLIVNGDGLSSGVYFIRLLAENQILVRKIVFIG